MVAYDLAILRDAADAVSRLGRDQIKMNAYVAKVASLPLPVEGSAAEKALSCRPMVTAYSRDTVLEIDRQLTTLAQNLRDTAAAYQAGEAENVVKVNQIWDDLGESPARKSSDPGDFPRLDKLDLEEPSRRLQDPVELVEPSLLPNKVLDLVTFVTGIPTEVADFIQIYFQFLMVVNAGESTHTSEWAKTAMGEYGPISKVGDGYGQLGEAYFELADQFDLISQQLKHGWTGDTAELAADYVQVMFAWINRDVAYGFQAIGDAYKGTAAAMYRNAARAAEEIADYLDALTALTVDLDIYLAAKLKPNMILFRTVSQAAKLVAKRFLVVNTVAQLLTIASNLLDHLATHTPIAPGEVSPPTRGYSGG